MRNKSLFQKKGFIPFLLAITTAIILLVGCPNNEGGGSSSSTPTVNTSETILSYADINAVAGTKFTRVYTTGDDFTTGTTFSNFTIMPNDGPDINENTGIITVPSGTSEDTAGTEYTITADVEDAGDTGIQKASAKFTLKVLAADNANVLKEKPVFQTVEADDAAGTVAVVEESDGSFSATVVPGQTGSKIPPPQFSGLDAIKDSIKYSLVQKVSAGSSSISAAVTDASGMVIKGITIDSKTGIITIDSVALAGISGTYIIYAEATGNYAGQQSAEIKITVAPLIPIAGTFSYGDENKKTTTYGTAMSYALTWTDATAGQTVEYAVTTTDLQEGISLDTISGEVSITNNVPVGAYVVAIAATGTGAFKDTISAELTITVEAKVIDALSYGSEGVVTVEKNSITEVIPRWDDSNTTASYAVKDGETLPAGVVLDAATGSLTINGPEVVSDSVVNIVATGSGNYTGSKEVAVTIKSTSLVIAGSFGYNSGSAATVESGVAATYAATWLNNAADQTVAYYISPTTEGITVDSDGTIAVATTAAAQAATEYTISAVGTGNYAGSIEAKISIAIIVQAGVLSYENAAGDAVSTASIAYGAAEATTYTKTWSGRTNIPDTTYSISPTTAGISIDAASGAITVATTVAAQAATDYTITATGTGVNTGIIVEATLSIEITAKPIAGTLSYNSGAAANLVYGAGASYAAAWASETSGQTVTYSISPTTAGITVGSDGTIAVSQTAAAQAAADYTITATGTGNYSGNTTATLSIAITKALGTLHYGDAGAVSVFNSDAAYVVSPVWSVAGITATYAVPATTGVAIAADTGIITIDGTAVATDTTVTVTATGTGDYAGNTATADITIKSVSKKIDGTIAYTAISTTFGTEKASEAPTWTGRTDDAQTVSYEISPQTAGITIAEDGIITVAADAAAKAQTSYTVTARGKGDFAGSVPVTSVEITIAAATIAAELSYGIGNAISIDATLDSYTVNPTWSVEGITATYAGPAGIILAPGVIIDATTGAISVTVAALAAGDSTVSVTATGTGNYTGTVTVGKITLTKNQQGITGTLSYNEGVAASSTYGTTTNYTTTWTGERSGQTVSYSISPATTGISVGADGTITVANTTAVQAATEYTITATGTKAYKGSKTATFSIAIAAKAIAGSFNYGNGAESFVFGTAKNYSATTQWGDSSQSVEYTLSPSISGISIDKANGAITVADTVAAGTHALSITATGTGNYRGTLTAGLTLIITKSLGALNYGAANAVSVLTSASAYKASPNWDEAGVTATYAVKDGTTAPAGVALEADGTLTIDGSAVTNGATIEITATGTGVYNGSTKEVTVTINTAADTIGGTLSYAAISAAYGAGATQSPAWSGETDGQTQTYSIVPIVDGISIDSATGIITVASTLNAAATTKYTVTASGSGNYGGTITAKVDITINVATIAADLSYGVGNAASVLANVTATITPTWSTSGITATYAVKADSTLPAGVTINASTGALTVVGKNLADGDSKIIVTATGTGNYTGTVDSAELTITKAKISITGVLNYNDGVAVSTAYGTSASYTATWANPVTGQTVTYSISPETTGITVGSDGTIAVADTTLAQAATNYTITATGSGDYKDSITANFSITILGKPVDGVLSYGDQTETQGSIPTVAYTPAWTTEPTDSAQKDNLAYTISISPYTNKITVDASGAVNLASDIVGGVYEVAVIASGTGNFGASIRTIFTLTINRDLGSFSYGSAGAISVANNEIITIAPVWNVIDNRTVSYAAKTGTTLPAGVTLDEATGVLSINGTTADLNGKAATIVATGTGLNAGQSAEATATITVKTQQITGAFTYSGTLSTIYGTTQSSSPTWSGETSGQTATYSISPEASGITVGTDGEVSVSASANVAASGEYTVTAQGNGDFGGSISAKISIDITPLAIAGTLSYTGTTSFTQGTAGTSDATWSGATSGQTVTYSISPETAGISIDNLGTITVANTVATGIYSLAVSASGTDNYTGSVTGAVTLTVTGTIAGAFSYGTVGVLSTATAGLSLSLKWTGANAGQTLRYAFSSSNANPAGISLDATTGALVVYGNAVAAGTYSIEAIGTGNYTGTISGTVIIETRNDEIAGTISYTAISTAYGTATTTTPIWSGEKAGQTLTYSINPETAGITITADGTISVANTVPASTTQYVVSATGSGNYGGSITTQVNISVVPQLISGSISYTVAESYSVGTNATVDVSANLADANSTLSYTIAPQDNGVSINASTGQITIAPISAAESKPYVITAIGTGNYSGSLTRHLINIAVNGALSGSFSYTASSIPTAGGSVTINPVWVGANAGQTVTYSVTPDTTATINANTGALTIAAADTYTVTATGTELYASSSRTTTVLVQSVDSIITGSFSYGGMTSTYGSDVSHAAPTWIGATINQTTSYTLTSNIAGISINASTGAIVVSSTVPVGSYTSSVVATGTGNYAGNVQSVLSLEVKTKTMEGALSYGSAITAVAGSTKVVDAIWSSAPAGQTVSYSISANNRGVSVNGSNGTITITPSTAFANETFVITAKGTGNYSGVVSANISVKANASLIGGFSYGLASVSTSETALIHTVEWVDAPDDQAVNYAFDSSTPPGLAINANTGTITIDGSTAQAGDYNINATAVAGGLYNGTISGDLKVTIASASITGDLSYDSPVISYGNSKLLTPTWTNIVDTQQTVVYSISSSTSVDGISINNANGAISVENTLYPGSYAIGVNVIGTGDYAGNITTSLGVVVNAIPIEGTLNTFSVDVTSGIKTNTSVPVWTNALSEQKVFYTLGNTISGISVDSSTGIITITEDLDLSPQIVTILLTATGHEGYSGSVGASITLDIKGSISSGNMFYQEMTVASSGITESFPPTWTGQLQEAAIRSMAYSFVTDDNVDPVGLSISSSDGVVFANGATVSAGDYTIKAMGINFFKGTVYGTISIKKATDTIAGTFTYPTSASDATSISLLETNFGTAKNSEAPTWASAAQNQTISYTITPTTDGVSIDSTTGVISILDTADVILPTTHTISAVGTGSFGGRISQSILIGINGIQLPSFSYEDLTRVYRSENTTLSPAWESSGVAEVTALYSITSGSNEGLSINESTGEISVRDIFSTSNSEITVKALGLGNYKGVSTTTVTITLTPSLTYEGAIAYDNIVTTYGAAYSQLVTLIGVPSYQTGSYSVSFTDIDGADISEVVSGILINSSSGQIHINSGAAVTNGPITATVTLTGTNHYEVPIDSSDKNEIVTSFTITINPRNIANSTLSYRDEVVGSDNIVASPSDSDLDSLYVDYVLDGAPAGITIDADGKITIIAADVTAGSYTITATGKENYSGTKSATLVITKPVDASPLSGDFTYDSLTVAMDSPVLENNTSAPVGLIGDASYSIDTSGAGISIDSSTGVVTVSKDAVADDVYRAYAITARGVGSSTGVRETQIQIKITKAICLIDDTITDGAITNWRQMANIKNDLTATYTLQNDIVLPDPGDCSDYDIKGWIPLGGSGSGFQGTFNGNHKTISNYQSTYEKNNYDGFFGRLRDATVQDFTLDVAAMDSNTSSILSGSLYGTTVNILNVRIISSNNAEIKTASPIAYWSYAKNIVISAAIELTLVLDAQSFVTGMLGFVQPGVSLDITGYFDGDMITKSGEADEGKASDNFGMFIGLYQSAEELSIKGYAVSNGNKTLAVTGMMGGINQYITPFFSDIEMIVRTNTVAPKFDNPLSRIPLQQDSVFNGVYNSINETFLTKDAYINKSPGYNNITDIAYSNTLSQSDFPNLTFGSAVGEWTWVEDGKFPAINIGSVAPAAEQRTEFVGDVTVGLDLMNTCIVPENAPRILNSVYQISNWKELRWMDNCNHGNFVLTNDIYMPTPGVDPLYDSEGWAPLFIEQFFYGSLDGKGFAIRDFYADFTSKVDRFGLISQMGTGATLKNLRIVHNGISFTKGGTFVGIAADPLYNYKITNIGLESSSDEYGVNVIYNSGYTAASSGGLVGFARGYDTSDLTTNSAIRGYFDSRLTVEIGSLVGTLRSQSVVGYTTNETFTSGNQNGVGNLFDGISSTFYVKGYAINSELVDQSSSTNFTPRLLASNVYIRSSATAADARVHWRKRNGTVPNAGTINKGGFTMQSSTTLAEFLAAPENEGFRDEEDSTKLDSDWIWVDGRWPAVNLLHPDDRDPSAADYVAPLVAPEDQPTGIQ